MARTAPVISVAALLAVAVALVSMASCSGAFRIGRGIYDITGTPAETGFMGYAMANQTAHGLHFRQRARAYIFADDSDASNRVVFVSSDLCFISQSLKVGVVEALQGLYGSQYSYDNVMIGATHTHSGPGGYAWDAMYDMTTLGFNRQNYDAIVGGITAAISAAHDSLTPAGGSLTLVQSVLTNTSINRSPPAFVENPEAEIVAFGGTWTDNTTTLLHLADATGAPLGLIHWFAVHCTSMNNRNELISGDNKGLAALWAEQHFNGNQSAPGTGPFVAAFAQANEGDSSPNIRGGQGSPEAGGPGFCPDGTPCVWATSTCSGRTEGCRAIGPGADDFESTAIIAQHQLDNAMAMWQTAERLVAGGGGGSGGDLDSESGLLAVALDGPLRFVHTHVVMSNFTVTPQWSGQPQNVTTCPAAMGYSFAAGTIDGPGEFSFEQGDNNTRGNAWWNFLTGFLHKPDAAQDACQAPKPILIDAGQIKFPYQWVPDIIPCQIFQLGNLYVIGAPGEFSTMAGRRLRDTVYQALVASGVSQPLVLLSGMTNVYAGYVTTWEEYQVQRYEGASTIYGPHQLAAYQQIFDGLARALVAGSPVPAGPSPPNLLDKQIDLHPGVIFDSGPFGSVYSDAEPGYLTGSTASVTFYGASPNNNLMTQNGTYLTVEQLQQDGSWAVVATDSHWETRFYWKRHDIAESLVTVTWDIPAATPAGSYRIRTFGYSKSILGKLTPYTGTSAVFVVKPASQW